MTRPLAKRDRARGEQYVSTHLPWHIGLLTRLLSRELREGYSYAEARLLISLSSGGPRRITDLAEQDGLAQPTTTLLVKRLEEQGLVRRERQTHDQRVVLVCLTDAGQSAIDDIRAIASARLRRRLDAMSDHQVEALAAATDALAELIATLQANTPRDEALE
jgi:DNA-binding MarR family transcriptional regulator